MNKAPSSPANNPLIQTSSELDERVANEEACNPSSLPSAPPDSGSLLRRDDSRHALENNNRSDMWRTQPTRPASPAENDEMNSFLKVMSCLTVNDSIFNIKPFSGTAHCGDKATKWLDQFVAYSNFKKLTDPDRMELFKLLMEDHARQWLDSLPENKKADLPTLLLEFKKRHALTRVDKWRQTANIWSRRQGTDESVDDYFAAMQTAAKQIDMDSSSLNDALIQGLRPELRLHVLHAEPTSIEETLELARVSEAAHSANVNKSTDVDRLNSKLDLILDKLATTTLDVENPSQTTTKKVTFTQAAIHQPQSDHGSTHRQPRSTNARSTSPVDLYEHNRHGHRATQRSPNRSITNERDRQRTPLSDHSRFNERWKRAQQRYLTALIPIIYGKRHQGVPTRHARAGLSRNGQPAKGSHFGTVGGGGWTSSSRKRA
jgi:hypothetical protein